jgi:RNA polymerase sigma-70 factor (ECF subfamily)
VTDPGVSSGEGQDFTSTSLLERARGQDRQAWERLVDLYTPLVYAWCRRSGLQPADAEDVGQEVFRAVARGLAGFRKDRDGDSFRGWLRTITRNKVRDFADARKRCPPGAGGSDVADRIEQLPEPEPEADLTADRQLLYQRALEVLRTEFEERTWQAFWRVVVEDVPADETARQLGTTLNAVYLAKSRVLRRLREEFADLIEDLPEPGAAPSS